MTHTNRAHTQDRIRSKLSRIAEIERELESEVREWEGRFSRELLATRRSAMAQLRQSTSEFRDDILEATPTMRFRALLTAPLIYGMIVPIVVLDLTFSLYQAVCFRLYGIDTVPRRSFIAIDRHNLEYLVAFEKLNCIYCGYANGVLGFAREIAARTEQYWCPIKHARRLLGTHERYAAFLEFGEDEPLEDTRASLRAALKASNQENCLKTRAGESRV